MKKIYYCVFNEVELFGRDDVRIYFSICCKENLKAGKGSAL
jgi:hypothetical protein